MIGSHCYKPAKPEEGWPFGRSLFLAEVMSLIQQVSSVKYVLDVEVVSRQIILGEEANLFDESGEKQLSVVEKVLHLPADGVVFR